MKLKELQREVDLWVRQCMGDAEAEDKRQRAFRFFEEALELAQACGMTREEAGALADYTFSRPPAGLRRPGSRARTRRAEARPA